MAKAIRTLAIVYALLIALLCLTVAASFAPLGRLNPVVSIGIALAKSALIFPFFMHLREEGSPVRLAAAAGAVWLLILLILSWIDFGTRGW